MRQVNAALSTELENEMKHTAKDRPDPIERAETDDEGKSIVKVDYEAGTSRFWNGEDFHGTGVVYAVRDKECLSIQCDYELNTLFESKPRTCARFARICGERASNGDVSETMSFTARWSSSLALS